MQILFKTEARACGPCSLCCKVMGIKDGDFDKPKDQWCPHAKKGRGCGIYPTRPSKCRDFQCLWLVGAFGGPEHRPDKIHAVVTPTTDKKNWVIHEDPGYAGHARRVLKPVIDQWLKRDVSHYVVVVCGTKRVFFGQRQKFEQLRTAGADEVNQIRDVVMR
jgi:hypothetical protein